MKLDFDRSSIAIGNKGAGIRPPNNRLPVAISVVLVSAEYADRRANRLIKKSNMSLAPLTTVYRALLRPNNYVTTLWLNNLFSPASERTRRSALRASRELGN